LVVGSVSAEQFKLTGTLVDAYDKAPLIGGTVVIKGADRRACTDLDGNFSIEVEKDDTLKISCVGWYSKEVEVLNDSSLVIELEEDEKLSGFDYCPVNICLCERIRRDPGRYRFVPIERDSTKTNPKKQNSMINH
jgi:hypothetical protein